METALLGQRHKKPVWAKLAAAHTQARDTANGKIYCLRYFTRETGTDNEKEVSKRSGRLLKHAVFLEIKRITVDFC